MDLKFLEGLREGPADHGRVVATAAPAWPIRFSFGAVKNLRFTQSVLEAFSNVLVVSREQHLIADPTQGFSAVVTPALLIKGFTFTGQTK